MGSLRRFQLYVIVAAVAVAAYVGWQFLDRHAGKRDWNRGRNQEQAQRAAEFERIYGGTAVKILQFYSAAGTLLEGDSATICYGVINAKSVRMEPPVDGVSVSLNRCVAAAPDEDTRYTLIAEGNDGRVVSESFVLQVKPDPATLPKITSFRIADHKIDHGHHIFVLSFTVQNAEEIDIEPRVFPTLHGAPYGSFYVKPGKTTTYTLTVAGKKGRKTWKQLTVEVPNT